MKKKQEVKHKDQEKLYQKTGSSGKLNIVCQRHDIKKEQKS